MFCVHCGRYIDGYAASVIRYFAPGIGGAIQLKIHKDRREIEGLKRPYCCACIGELAKMFEDDPEVVNEWRMPLGDEVV